MTPWLMSVGSCLSAGDGARQIESGREQLVDGCDCRPEYLEQGNVTIHTQEQMYSCVSRAAGVLTGLPGGELGRLPGRCGPVRE